MARNEPDPAQLTLISTDRPRKPGRRKTGRHERALDAALKESPELRKPVMAAAVSLARALAAGLDRAELDGKGYETSQLAGQYRDQLRPLGLMPDLSGGDDDAADALDFGGAE